MKIFVVIPAYNEETTIASVIEDLKKNNYQNIVVVDDGSTDKTKEKAEGAGVIVLRHLVNRGQGAALKTGIDYALEKGAEILVTFDADGQHQAKDVEKLIKPIEEGEAEVVLGSRFLSNCSVPLIRKFFLKGGALIFRLFYGVKVTDSHNGLRALSRKAAQEIKIKGEGMEHASEIIEEIGQKKIKYKEVPVEIKYTSYSSQKGQKSWVAFKILFKMLIKAFLK